MNCEEIREILPLYMEGLTEEHETSLIEEHLAHCPSCQKYVEEMEDLQLKLKNLPSVAMPESAKAQVSGAIKEEGKRIRERRKKNRILRFSSLAAVLMLGLFSLVMGSQMGDFFYQPEKASETEPVLINEVSPEHENEGLSEEPGEETGTFSPALKDKEYQDTGGTEEVAPFAPEKRMVGEPEPEDQNPEEVMMMTLPPQPVDPYLDLLAEELAGQDYQILDWEETEPEVFLIHIELTETDESGKITRIPVRYQGQEGTLCRIE